MDATTIGIESGVPGVQQPEKPRFVDPSREYKAVEFTSWWWLDSAYASTIRSIWLREDKYSQNKIMRKKERGKGKPITADTSSLEQAVSGFIGFLQEAPNYISASPRTENDAPVASIVESDLKDQYRINEPIIVGQKTLYDLVLRGMPFMRVERDPELCSFEEPNGKVTVQPLDPFDVYLDSRAHSRKDVRRITVLNWMQRRDARARWQIQDDQGNWVDDPIFKMGPICGTIRNYGRAYGEATDEFDVIPVACTYFLEMRREMTLFPDIVDVQKLAQIGIQAQPGVAMACPPNYQTQAHGKCQIQKMPVWYYAYHYNHKILEGPKATYTYNCPIKFTGAIPFKMHEYEGPFGPYSVGIIYKVMDLQLLKSIMDTIFAQMAVSNLGVWVSVNSGMLTKDSNDKVMAAIKSKDPVRVLQVELKSVVPGKELKLSDVVEFKFPQQANLAPLEGAKYMAEQILAQIGMRDQTTGGGNATDPYIKYEQRIQQSMLQMKPIVQAYEDFVQEIMEEVYECRRRMLDYETTVRTMAVDLTEFLTINKRIPIDEFRQDVLHGVYPADIPRVVDNVNGFVIVNPFGGNHEISVEVSALSKDEQIKQYQEALQDVTAGMISREDALKLHPRWGKAPQRYLQKAIQDYIQRTELQLKLQPPAPPPEKVSISGTLEQSQVPTVMEAIGIKVPKATASEVKANVAKANPKPAVKVRKAA